MDGLRILHEEEQFIVAYKPCGVLSEDRDKEEGMPALLRRHTGGGIYPVHRLDRTTQGLMVYAKTASCAAKLSAALQSGSLTKEYLAVVEGVPDESGQLSDLLYYDRKKGKSYVVTRQRRGVREARLSYSRLGTAEYAGSPASLLRIALLTGRTHQIRVQFASRRHPLVGDRRYGSAITAPNIALCSCTLTFPHPETGEILTFSDYPTDEIFRRFEFQ